MTKLIIDNATRQRRRVRLPFNARPVSAAGRVDRSGPYATHHTAVANYGYIMREPATDRFGTVPDGYLLRHDLVTTGLCHPQQRMPAELKSGDRIWREADEAAALEGLHAVSATHLVADLPPDVTPERWRWLVERYAFSALVELGMVVAWAIHAKADANGGWAVPPHVHLLCTARFWRNNPRKGDRQKQWLASAAQIRAAEGAWLELVGLTPAAAVTLAA